MVNPLFGDISARHLRALMEETMFADVTQSFCLCFFNSSPYFLDSIRLSLFEVYHDPCQLSGDVIVSRLHEFLSSAYPRFGLGLMHHTPPNQPTPDSLALDALALDTVCNWQAWHRCMINMWFCWRADARARASFQSRSTECMLLCRPVVTDCQHAAAAIWSQVQIQSRPKSADCTQQYKILPWWWTLMNALRERLTLPSSPFNSTFEDFVLFLLLNSTSTQHWRFGMKERDEAT